MYDIASLGARVNGRRRVRKGAGHTSQAISTSPSAISRAVDHMSRRRKVRMIGRMTVGGKDTDTRLGRGGRDLSVCGSRVKEGWED